MANGGNGYMGTTPMIGNVGQIEGRNAQSGKRVATLSLAVQTYRDESPRWVRLVAFDKQAENLEKFAPKGTRIFIVTEYSPREYEAQGEKRHVHEFIVKDFSLISNKQNGGGNTGAATSEADTYTDGAATVEEDDLPF